MTNNATNPPPQDDKDRERPSSVRWWEQYTVRYFVGTVIGAAILFVLREKARLSSDFALWIPPFNKIDVKQMSAVAMAGLAYCYIASVPTLTLHATRSAFHSRTKVAKATLTSSIIVCILILIVSAVRESSDDKTASVVAGVIVLAIVGGQLALIVTTDSTATAKFYKDLAGRRHSDWAQKRDYTESYRHLREHGNAVSIVVCEILLGLVIAAASTPTYLVAMVLLWLLPGAYSWFVGTSLEGQNDWS